MKKIFLLLTLAFALNTISAQHFTILGMLDGVDYTNSELVVDNTGDDAEPMNELVCDFYIFNNTEFEMKLGLKFRTFEADECFIPYFCLENCFEPSVTELPENRRPIIAPGESREFNAHFDSYLLDENGDPVFDENFSYIPVKGSIIVEYVFYSDEFPEDNSKILIKYHNGKVAGIVSYNQKFETTIYPNPVIDVANINYQLPTDIENATLSIVSCTGSKLKETQLMQNQNMISINVSDLPSGIYFYTINNKGRIIATNKFVIK
ncbi:T9SS type A sorting domain-containing protein [Odoribacter sp. OttesenSCG-928-L07]|nr:T9SS type A sorting domain-containing protein [Odoribacter sp. OttesenSCG-928-L07]